MLRSPVLGLRTRVSRGGRAALAVLISMSLATCAWATSSSRGEGILSLPVIWQDDQGRDIRLADTAAGQPVIITMAYGACRKVCSTSMRRMEEVQAMADARGQRLQFVVVSLDPKADTPEDWRAFRHSHHLDRDNWHFMRGTAKETRMLASLLGIGYWAYDDHVIHDFRVLRLGLHGRIEAMLTTASDDPASLLTSSKGSATNEIE